MSKEENSPEPSIDAETLLTIHELFDELIGEMSFPEVWNGDKLTFLQHKKVFPTYTCEGNLTIEHVDPTVGYASFECEKGCTHTKTYRNGRGETFSDEQKNFDLLFEDAGYLSNDIVIDDNGDHHLQIKPGTYPGIEGVLTINEDGSFEIERD